MDNLRKIFLMILVMVFSFFLSFAAEGEMIGMIVKPKIAQLKDGLTVSYEITNKGSEEARHLSVTTFLARQTSHSDGLGDALPDQMIRYSVELNTADLVSGEYVLAARVSFSGADSKTHRVYHFSSVKIRPADVMRKDAGLGVNLKSPAFNPKSFWQEEGRFVLTMENNLPEAVEPAVLFFMPDGFTVAEPETVYPLSAQEKKIMKIPVSLESNAADMSPYHALIWYETNGRHYSQLIKGTIRLQARPVYFKLFLMAGGVVVLALIVMYFIRLWKSAVKK